MISIEENVDLSPYNTFRIKAKARFFCRVHSEADLKELMNHDIYTNNRHLILGGGSNILFIHDFDGLVIKSELKGMYVSREDDTFLQLTIASGEEWHATVMHCVNHNWGGIENLALIPGTTGAAPIQNIGAYGIELKDVVHSVKGIHIPTGKSETILAAQCGFGYRESIFKHELKEIFFISSVTLTLRKKNHILCTHYGAIAETLRSKHITTPTIQSICDAVIDIRQHKLPDPKVIGNAGSFFKNPSIDQTTFQELHDKYPLMPHYSSENQLIKVPAGWLIEQCGWKGKRRNDVGVHAHQALVLVNYGDGTGNEIFLLAMDIQASVKEKFGIMLTPEVNIILS
jgi:UDP-N-acetylmuramate dehydrogenase